MLRFCGRNFSLSNLFPEHVLLRSLAPLAALLFFSVSGCGASVAPSAVPLSEWGGQSITWSPCPDELGGAQVECTLVEVPLEWDDPQSARTSVLLRRISGPQGAEGSLWALDGGPGFAGDSFLDPAFANRVRDAGLTLYVPSHRGSIGPSALRCPIEQHPDSAEGGRVTAEEWPACRRALEAQWGSHLPPFSVREAARDVAHLIERATPPGRRLLFGGSYGTLWAHRLLLDTDATLDSVLLDSIVPIGASLERVEEHADQAAATLLDACAAEPECAARFPGLSADAARAAIAAYANGNGCADAAEGVSREALQAFVHQHLAGPPSSWETIRTLFSHLIQCSDDDARALEALLKPAESTRASAAAQQAPHYNPLLNRHLLYREIYRFDRPASEREEFLRTALAADPNTPSVEAEAKAFGATYRRDDPPTTSSTQIPTYLLSGRLDPLNPPAWAEAYKETLENGVLVSIPWAGHSTLRYLGLAPDGCGSTVLASFLRTGVPNTDCVP